MKLTRGKDLNKRGKREGGRAEEREERDRKGREISYWVLNIPDQHVW